MRAFHDDPVMRWLFPDDNDYFAPQGAVFAGEMAVWIATEHVWCTEDGVGVAVWMPPKPADPPGGGSSANHPSGNETAAEAVDSAHPISGETVPSDLAQRFALIGTHMAANQPDEPYWYLQLLGTHPDWQRQGIGETLMRPGFEQADADGLLCHLETERPELVAYYRRYGFDVTAEWDVDPDAITGTAGPHMWAMSRSPR